MEKEASSPRKNKTSKPRHGKKPNQKLKPYLVLQYLLKHTDENNVATADGIIDYLKDDCNIYAERRSIYRDIQEINKILLMQNENCTLIEAEEILEEDEEAKAVVYDKSKKGFYMKRRDFDFYDVRILAECIYSSKFLTKSQSERLVDTICKLASDEQAKKIKHDATLIDRTRAINKEVVSSIEIISDAMSKELDGQPHVPEKITFHYLHHTIDDVTTQIPRRKNKKYTVSPYYLVIDNSNYYLLCFDGKNKKTYRVDRMKNVALTGEPREGAGLFNDVDMKEYLRQTFFMYQGTIERVTIRFVPTLLDTMIDRFGNDRNAHYGKEYVDGKERYTVSVKVGISDQFYGWLLGFGKRAVLTSPPDVVQKFTDYLDNIRTKYQ